MTRRLNNFRRCSRCGRKVHINDSVHSRFTGNSYCTSLLQKERCDAIAEAEARYLASLPDVGQLDLSVLDPIPTTNGRRRKRT